MIDLVAGTDRAAVDPASGGRLVSLVAGGRERILQSPSPVVDLESIGRGAFVMAPFVGRLRDGRVDWQTRHENVPRNLGHHAIHGAVFDVPWSVLEATPDSVRLGVHLDSGRWPWRGEVRQDIALRPGRLSLALEIVAGEDMPVAVGWHPWFRVDPGEDASIRIDADAVLETGQDMIPTGRRLPVDGSTDLREARPVSGLRLDHAYIGARSPAVIRWSDLELDMAFEPPVSTVVVFTPPGAFCVEPQTSWPDALRLNEAGIDGTGLAVVRAGHTFRAETAWVWHPV